MIQFSNETKGLKRLVLVKSPSDIRGAKKFACHFRLLVFLSLFRLYWTRLVLIYRITDVF